MPDNEHFPANPDDQPERPEVEWHDIEFDKLLPAQQYQILRARQNAARTTFEHVAQEGRDVLGDLSYNDARARKQAADIAIQEFIEKHGLFPPGED